MADHPLTDPLHALAQVADGPGGLEVHRIPAPGGWVYITYTWDPETERLDTVDTVFVPDATRRIELLDAAQGVLDVAADHLQLFMSEEGLEEVEDAIDQLRQALEVAG